MFLVLSFLLDDESETRTKVNNTPSQTGHKKITDLIEQLQILITLRNFLGMSIVSKKQIDSVRQFA